MGALAVALIGGAVAAGTTAYGASQNKKAQKANERAKQESEDDFEERTIRAGEIAAELNKQYNEVVKNRPNLTWETFVRDRLREIDDPMAREVYTNAKAQDFENLRNFAQQATKGNVQTLLDSAEEISGGRFKEFLNKRNELISNTDVASRFQRANELAAPLRQDASTVKYDSQGRLIEGQRSDKQTFLTAQETIDATQREQKEDLRAWQSDMLDAARSQQQKATEFTNFFDPTSFANTLGQQKQALQIGYQSTDEDRAYDIMKMFAAASQGIQPQQPNYQNPNPGNEMISAGIKMGTQAATDYFKSTNKNSTY